MTGKQLQAIRPAYLQKLHDRALQAFGASTKQEATMPRFYRVRLAKRSRPVLVAVTNDAGRSTLHGLEVTKSGEPREWSNAHTVRQHLVIFKRTDIVCELTMNLHYGELEESVS